MTLNGQDVELNSHPRTKWRTRFGTIGLQDHRDAVWFRSIRLNDLGSPTHDQWTPLISPDFLRHRKMGGEAKAYERRGVLTLERGRLTSRKAYQEFQRWTNLKSNAQTQEAIWVRSTSEAVGHRVRIYNNSIAPLRILTGVIDQTTPLDKLPMSSNDCSPLTVMANHKRIETHANGIPLSVWDEAKAHAGHIVLQAENGSIPFEDLRFKPFK